MIAHSHSISPSSDKVTVEYSKLSDMLFSFIILIDFYNTKNITLKLYQNN